jgi:hypothetical protein
MVSTRLPPIAVRILGSAAAGFVTFCFLTLSLGFAVRDSWLAFQWRRVFGLGPLLATAMDRNWFEGEGLLEPGTVLPRLGDQIYDYVFLGFWPLLFAALYFCFVFRRRQTI